MPNIFFSFVDSRYLGCTFSEWTLHNDCSHFQSSKTTRLASLLYNIYAVCGQKQRKTGNQFGILLLSYAKLDLFGLALLSLVNRHLKIMSVVVGISPSGLRPSGLREERALKERFGSSALVRFRLYTLGNNEKPRRLALFAHVANTL